jgi:hypothetical protein
LIQETQQKYTLAAKSHSPGTNAPLNKTAERIRE